MGSLVAYPVDNPVFLGGSAKSDGNFVTTTGRGSRAVADRFPSDFSFISSDDAVIRGGSEATLATTRGGVA